MKILGKKSDRLEGRELRDSVCVECDCGEHLFWPRGAGNKVTCPTCKQTGEINLDGKQKSPEDLLTPLLDDPLLRGKSTGDVIDILRLMQKAISLKEGDNADA